MINFRGEVLEYKNEVLIQGICKYDPIFKDDRGMCLLQFSVIVERKNKKTGNVVIQNIPVSFFNKQAREVFDRLFKDMWCEVCGSVCTSVRKDTMGVWQREMYVQAKTISILSEED